MSTINERIGELVDSLGMTKTAFADSLKVSQQYISKLIKTGNPSELLVDDICEKFNVCEDWLRNGEGEMFKKPNRQQEIASMTAMLFKEEETSFKYRLIAALSKMDEDEWKILERLAKDITEKKD